MKRVTFFLAILFLFTSCCESDSDSILGDIIWSAATYGIANTNDPNNDSQMSLASDVNLAETTDDAFVQLIVDDEYVYIPFNAQKPIQICNDSPILRSYNSDDANKILHVLTYQLEGFELYKLENIKSSKNFDNTLFFKKGNEIIEVDFDTHSSNKIPSELSHIK